MSWAGRLLFVVAILAGPPAARAAGKEATERAAQAQAACLSGDYARGVGILAELYVSSRDPAHIYNQGRCFEQNGKYEDAIVRFREFQRKNANAGRPPDPAAEQHITDCQTLLDKRKSAAPVAPVSPPVGLARPAVVESQPAPVTPRLHAQPEMTSPPAIVPSDKEANQVDLVQSAPTSGQRRPETSIFARWWFWTAVGVVVAGGVTTGLLLSRGGGTKPFCPDCASIAPVDLP